MISTELLIIGCGPAGMMAAIYAKRAGKQVRIVEKASPGGRVKSTFQVENYLGFGRVNAEELVSNMVTHLHALGITDDYGTVKHVALTSDGFLVQTDLETYFAQAVIVASGTFPKPIGAPGEDRLLSKGVSYCAVCDGFFYENRPVVVIGGGDSALDESLYMASLASSVVLVHDLEEFTASALTIQKVLAHQNIRVRRGCAVVEFRGEDRLETVRILHRRDNVIEDLKADGAFLYVGNRPETSFLQDLNVTDASGYILANSEMASAVPGLFGAGDVIRKDYRLIATAISDGAIAALGAVKYLESIKRR